MRQLRTHSSLLVIAAPGGFELRIHDELQQREYVIREAKIKGE